MNLTKRADGTTSLTAMFNLIVVLAVGLGELAGEVLGLALELPAWASSILVALVAIGNYALRFRTSAPMAPVRGDSNSRGFARPGLLLLGLIVAFVLVFVVACCPRQIQVTDPTTPIRVRISQGPPCVVETLVGGEVVQRVRAADGVPCTREGAGAPAHPLAPRNAP